MAVLVSPPLPAMAETMAEIDIARPGVAGPFLAALYFDLECWHAAGAPDPAQWVLAILERRRAPEPDTLPVSVGIDFLAHELCVTPDHLRRLVTIGRRDIAQEAAADARIDLDAVLGARRAEG